MLLRECGKKRLELRHDLRFTDHRRLQTAQDLQQQPVRASVEPRTARSVLKSIGRLGKQHFAQTRPPDGNAGRNRTAIRLAVYDRQGHRINLVDRTVAHLSPFCQQPGQGAKRVSSSRLGLRALAARS